MVVISVNPKEYAQQTLSEIIAKLTMNKEGKECNVNAAVAPGIFEIESERFRTPTGRENRIPEPLTCPPAPRRGLKVASSLSTETLSDIFAKLRIDVKEQGKEWNVVSDSGFSETEKEENFRTPTGREYKIPEPLTCPPAPRRP
ncbi:hypothetical protein CCACVL1_17367 [Corchorus capsularis]|uniref:Uncharacterized protein n=1 Tax=Corchorus capsularis TaxID=210143 RepID=A0A1R3HSB0_COCAP|nr:hypothetical protein CCACVL1_17367 [Corchorus capsularis]